MASLTGFPHFYSRPPTTQHKSQKKTQRNRVPIRWSGNLNKYSVSTCAPAVSSHVGLRLGMRSNHAWHRLPQPWRWQPTRAARIYRRRIDARCAPWPRRDHAADSARAPRFILAIAADFSPPAPHHDITLWWRSQCSDASRKCAAQLSLDSSGDKAPEHRCA